MKLEPSSGESIIWLSGFIVPEAINNQQPTPAASSQDSRLPDRNYYFDITSVTEDTTPSQCTIRSGEHGHEFVWLQKTFCRWEIIMETDLSSYKGKKPAHQRYWRELRIKFGENTRTWLYLSCEQYCFLPKMVLCPIDATISYLFRKICSRAYSSHDGNISEAGCIALKKNL